MAFLKYFFSLLSSIYLENWRGTSGEQKALLIAGILSGLNVYLSCAYLLQSLWVFMCISPGMLEKVQLPVVNLKLRFVSGNISFLTHGPYYDFQSHQIVN